MSNDELLVSNALLREPVQLQARLAEDGYLFFRDVLDVQAIQNLRMHILEIFRDKGWANAAGEPTRIPTVEGEDDFFSIYDEVQKLKQFHSLAHDSELSTIMRDTVGPSAFPHPLTIARLVFPDNEECTTPLHQDFPNNQGTKALYASWIPLSDCPRQLGGLSILEGSPSLGVLPLKFSLGAGGRQASLSEDANKLRWLTTDYRCGDVLIFGAMTVHRSLPNQSSNQFRLSVDFRFQEEGQPLTSTVLEPHFGRLSWDQIYANWKSDALQYYWRDKQFDIAPWDESLHALPDDHMKDAIRLSRQYRQRREQLASDED